MRYFVITLVLFGISAYGQQTTRWIYGVENQKEFRYAIKDSIKTEKYLIYDFAKLIKPNTEFLGFIGTGYKRIRIDFLDVKKSVDNNSIYKVSGSTTVGSNTCDFFGELKIKRIREYESLHFGVDSIYADSGIVAQGFVIAEYEFKETKSQKYSGTFKGIMTLWFYVNNIGEIIYDNIENHSDHYKNNQYVGEWKQYESDKSKICNWGEYRIPLSGDLDVGAGEFSVNLKYLSNGWQDH